MPAFVSLKAEATPAQMLALAVAANAALRGETANTTTVSAASGSTSVTVQDARCRAGRYAVLIPLNAAGANANWYLSSMSYGSMTFTFTSALTGAATFGVAFLGCGDK